MISISDIPFDDEKTWDLIRSGYTKGIFQCESRLVQNWLKRIKPINLWELSAVIAIVRPGALQSGFAEEYVAYRDGDKEFKSFGNPIVDKIFNATNGVLLYQESLINLGLKLAWPDKEEMERLRLADRLRKGVGKKDQKKLNEIGEEFKIGCINNGVEQELADRLFEIIKNCGRYLFNLSHSFAYACWAYITAYLKTHYPHQFFATYFTYAQFKLKKWIEIDQLAKEAKFLGIGVRPPNINKKNFNFCCSDNTILYGLSHVKYFTNKSFELIQNLPHINNWKQVLLICGTDTFGSKMNSRVSEALICSGAFSDTGVNRKYLLSVYKLYEELSPKEKGWVIEHLEDIDTITEFSTLVAKCGEEVSMANRKKTIRSLLALFEPEEYDDPRWVEQHEIKFLGVQLTASGVDDKKTMATDFCVDCHNEQPTWVRKHVAVILDTIRITETKKGKNPGAAMAILSAHDSTANIENIPLFPEAYEKYQDFIIENNTVELYITKGKGGWFIEKVVQI